MAISSLYSLRLTQHWVDPQIILVYDSKNGCRFSAWEITGGIVFCYTQVEFFIPCSQNAFERLIDCMSHRQFVDLMQQFHLAPSYTPLPRRTLSFLPRISIIAERAGLGERPWVRHFAHLYVMPLALPAPLTYPTTEASLPLEFACETLPTHALMRALDAILVQRDARGIKPLRDWIAECFARCKAAGPEERPAWYRALALHLLYAPFSSMDLRGFPTFLHALSREVNEALTTGDSSLFQQLFACTALIECFFLSHKKEEWLAQPLCESVSQTLERASRHVSLCIAAQASYAVGLLTLIPDNERPSEHMRRKGKDVYAMALQLLAVPHHLAVVHIPGALNNLNAAYQDAQALLQERCRIQPLWIQAARL